MHFIEKKSIDANSNSNKQVWLFVQKSPYQQPKGNVNHESSSVWEFLTSFKHDHTVTFLETNSYPIRPCCYECEED